MLLINQMRLFNQIGSFNYLFYFQKELEEKIQDLRRQLAEKELKIQRLISAANRPVAIQSPGTFKKIILLICENIIMHTV